MVREFWWGKLSLAASFWNIFIGGWLLCAVIGGFTYPLIYLVCPLVARFLLLIILFVYPLWATVGVWRSANSGKSRPVWGVLAKGVTGFYFINIVYHAVVNSQHMMGILMQ